MDKNMRIMLQDNGGRRSGNDRRKMTVSPKTYEQSNHSKEQRKNEDRRICPDRRTDKYREAYVRDVPAQRISNYKILGFG